MRKVYTGRVRYVCGLWVSALIFVCGCSSTRVATAITRFPEETARPVPPAVTPVEAETNTPPAITAAETSFPPLAETNPPPVLSPTNWIRADRWLAEHRATDVIIRAGSKTVEFAGVANTLGFEPVRRDGSLRIHPLDVAKNLEPLIQSRPTLVNRTVVIDPGHGGVNAGTRAITGNRFEKDFTLDWALRLKPLLEAGGWTVLLTRTNDIDLSLAERVDFAEASGAALFVSLHFNSGFPNQKASGLETYCLTPAGMPSTLVRQYADDPSATYPNNRHDADNVRLAMRIQRAVLGATGAADRGVRRARFMDVLRWQNRPAVLIEGGYLSNPEEARKISTANYRQRLAAGVARALE